MAAPSGCNEGFTVLNDFVCEATPSPGIPLATSPGTGVNAGIMVSDADVQNAPSHTSTLQIEELRKLSFPELTNLINLLTEPSREELFMIYDVILEKLKLSKIPISKDTKNILRESMLVLLNENSL
jgi:hypothetical protein